MTEDSRSRRSEIRTTDDRGQQKPEVGGQRSEVTYEK
jgi:hypothetical protein